MVRGTVIFCGELKSELLKEFLEQHYELICFQTNTEFYNSSEISLNNVKILILSVDGTLQLSLLEKMPALELLVSLSTSVTHISNEALDILGKLKKLLTLRDFWSKMQKVTGAADLALTLLLMGARKIPLSQITEFNYASYQRDIEYISHEFSNLKIGIIGYGRIGQRVARYLKAMDVRVSVFDEDLDKTIGECTVSSISEILNNVHGVLLSASMSDNFSKIISKQILSNEFDNDDLFLVNISRGELVSEEQVLHCLETGKLSCYLTDVISDEFREAMTANDFSHRLNKLRASGRLLVTPHVGGFTLESTQKTQDIIAQYLMEQRN